MNLLIAAVQWLGDNSAALPSRTLEHLVLSASVLLCAGLLALPVGMWVGHTGRGAAVVGAVAVMGRALPTLGLLTIFGLLLGIGLQAPFIALVILAIPSLLGASYAGIAAVERSVVDAATGVGMSWWQVIWRVELPLALPVIIGGLRAGMLQVIATATLAAYTADVGLGRFLFAGLKARDYPQMLGGALVVIALALVLEVVFAAWQRRALAKIT